MPKIIIVDQSWEVRGQKLFKEKANHWLFFPLRRHKKGLARYPTKKTRPRQCDEREKKAMLVYLGRTH